MPTDASIAMSVQDNLSAAITSMKNSVTNFRTDITSLQGELDRLNSTRVQMRMDLSGAKREAQQAQRAMEALGDSASEAERKAAEADWRKAEENLENIRQQYDLVGRQVRQTTRDMENATSAISRAENRAGSAVSGGGTTGLLAALGKAGILNMAGDTTSQLANALVGSAFGGQAGALFSGALSGAVSGAALGSIIPGVGTVAGAAIGGGIGLLSGATQNFQERDEAFKSYYGALYDAQKEAASQRLESGTGTAAQWELDAIAFNQLLGSGVGDQYLSDLRELAASTPMEYSDLTSMSRALATGFGDSPERMLELMTAIGDAGSAVGVTASDMTEMARAMSRMQSSGKATLEYLNIFQDRGVDVIGMLGEAMGKTQGEIYDMISKGEINGQNAATIIQQGMESAYSGAMDLMSETFSGLTSTLQDAITEINAATGQGYNPVRSQGMEEEIAAYEGPLGEALKKINEIEGENAAYDENMAERYTREALSAVLLGEKTSYIFDPEQQTELERMRGEFIDASLAYENGSREAGDKMADLREQAIALATASYDSSDRALALEEAERDQIAAIRDNTEALNGWRSKYQTELEKQKGGASSRMNVTEVDTPDIIQSLPEKTKEKIRKQAGFDPDEIPAGFAYGLSRVPRDGLYYLHQDERVQTAQEARSEKASTPLQITITGNTFGAGVTAEEMAQRLADAIERKLAAGVLS